MKYLLNYWMCDLYWHTSYRNAEASHCLAYYLGDSLDNWNEMLGKEITKDMRLIHPFHTLFTDMDFSIFDLLWVRDFNIEITAESDYDSYPESENKYDDIDWEKYDFN